MVDDPFAWTENCSRMSSSQQLEMGEAVLMVSPPDTVVDVEEKEEYSTPPERHSSSIEEKMGGEEDDSGGEDRGEEEEEREREKEVDLDEDEGEDEDECNPAKRLKVCDNGLVENSRGGGASKVVEDVEMEIDGVDGDRCELVVADLSVKNAFLDVAGVVVAVESESGGEFKGNGKGSGMDDVQFIGRNTEDGNEGFGCGCPGVPVLSKCKASVNCRKLPASFYNGEGGGGSKRIGEEGSGLGHGRRVGGGSCGLGSGSGMGVGEKTRKGVGVGVGEVGISIGHCGTKCGEGDCGAKNIEGGRESEMEGYVFSEQDMNKNLWNVLDFLAYLKKPVYKEKVDIIGAAIKAGIVFLQPSWWPAEESDDDSFS